MKDINYVIGRLQGLNELVKILKDLEPAYYIIDILHFFYIEVMVS
jgi:hypothetical protein